MEGNALVVGSRVYGAPRSDSDVDLVLLLSQKEIAIIIKSEQGTLVAAPSLEDSNAAYPGYVYNFDKLQLLMTDDPVFFNTWSSGMDEIMRLGRKVTRLEAKAIFQHHRSMAGFPIHG